LGEETEDRTAQLAAEYSRWYGGKVEIAPKVPVRSLDDFSIWYTPGVAEVSRRVARDPDLSFEYTGRWNTIAIVTDGSRVLGLGNIGPEASMPVMEGKALIYKFLGGVDAVPVPLAAGETDRFIDVISALEPAFGGINLEDTASPKCFHILDKLRERMRIPVWHDDQQGTAGVTLAGLFNALKVTGRRLRGSRVVLFGAGAANIATARLLLAAGAKAGDLVLVDSKGILHPEREDIDELFLKHRWKYELALKTNADRLEGTLEVALKGADALIAASRPGPDVVQGAWLRGMNPHPVVFLLANPVPEMWPKDALAAGAGVVATGRSDFPNQVNNSLLFPAVFRGVLDVRAKTITDEMVIAAAEELARFAEQRRLSRDYILPTMVEWRVYPQVAARVGLKAIEQGVARKKASRAELVATAERIIRRSKKLLGALVRHRVISPPPRPSVKVKVRAR
jgi:malate dehydrogenase (oxaloacetate-decarboxylating)